MAELQIVESFSPEYQEKEAENSVSIGFTAASHK